ncbi:endonuclease III [Corynebacterium tapiri]|uniref:Endonuclease III n=1 Tax=Corynebacterium tapiri TaxID=1448266 RepID=A0A5C4U337_9CORY|nr:endonuclease III [Corynebacterium tapiri]TNL97358.1 endonuclease III [Corynebacterium tapiri]
MSPAETASGSLTPANLPRVGSHRAARGKETDLGATRRLRRINRTLAAVYPDAHAELDFNSAFELLIATVLSAQTTDVRVNQVTPRLFARFPNAAALAGASPAEVEEIIRPTGFYRAKAANIISLAQSLVTEHGGQVPEGLDDLVRLAGVGRKTAHVVRGNAFGQPGLTVDTHFQRLMARFRVIDGLGQKPTPEQIEKEVGRRVEKREWTDFSQRIIWHGRRYCHARKAACGVCPLAADCPSFGIAGPAEPGAAQSLVSEADLARRDNLEALR